MLARLEREGAASSGGISKRIELASAVSGTISATFKRVEMLVHHQIASGRCAAGIASPRAVAEMLAVMAAPAAEDRPLVRRNFELCLGEHRSDRRAILFFEFARVGSDAPIDQGLQRLVDLEQLRNEAPVPVEPFGHPPSAFLGAVAEADRPLGRELAMIGDFLDRLRRNSTRKRSLDRVSRSNSMCCHVENRRCRAIVRAKSPLGCSTNRQLRKSSTSRWKASLSPSPASLEQDASPARSGRATGSPG